MKFVVEFRPRASADVAEAFSWYEAQRPGLGAEFEADLDRSVELLKQMAAAGHVFYFSGAMTLADTARIVLPA